MYWKKFVIWRHHFQPSIFSMIVSLFHGITWSDPHVKETVFISRHLLQPSIIASGLWLIWEKLKSMPSIPWSCSVFVFVVLRMVITHYLKCTVLVSFVVPLPSLAVTHCHLLSLVVTRCHSCITCCHSLSLIVILCHSLYHSLSLVVTRCITRLSFYKRSF